MKINQAIMAAMAEIGAISKNRKNPQQGYQFRGIDDVLNALQPALIKANVFIVPRITEMRQQERATKAGGTIIYTVVKGEYDFTSSEDGSKITAVTYGEGMDTSDKSTNKAMSAALKYAVLQTLSIPTEEMVDSERDHIEPAKKPEPAKAPTKQPTKQEQPAPVPPAPIAQQVDELQEPWTTAQRKALFAKCLEAKMNRDEAKGFADWALELSSSKEWTKHYASKVLEDFDDLMQQFMQ